MVSTYAIFGLSWVCFQSATLLCMKGLSSAGTLACVASVSILFRSKERPRNGILGFLAARDMTSPLTRAIFARSLTLAPRFLLRNSTETLATQAMGTLRVLRFTLSSPQILT